MTAALAAAGLLAVVALAGSWLLLRRRDRRIASPEDAAQAVEATLAGFGTTGAVVGADGAAALVVGGGGRVAVCRRRGGAIAVREVAWQAIRATADGMRVDTGDRGFGTVLVAGIDALDVRRLAPAGIRRS